ncbi:MAG: hypothetical protein HDT01_05430, partial [Bacteroidales bacterium]|nr:hypothetical protein [Bacteroidales bacterium]
MRLLYTLLISLVAAVTGLAQNIQHHVVEVGDFTHLEVDHAINVDYCSVADSAGLAVFDAAPEITNYIQFKNNGKGKLEIEIELNEDNQYPKNLPTLKIYSRFLTHIENSADSTVRVMSVNAGPKFKAVLIGNGRLSLKDVFTDDLTAKIMTGRGQLAISGKTQKAHLSITGVGAIQADELVAEEVTATVTGPCTI